MGKLVIISLQLAYFKDKRCVFHQQIEDILEKKLRDAFSLKKYDFQQHRHPYKNFCKQVMKDAFAMQRLKNAAERRSTCRKNLLRYSRERDFQHLTFWQFLANRGTLGKDRRRRGSPAAADRFLLPVLQAGFLARVER